MRAPLYHSLTSQCTLTSHPQDEDGQLVSFVGVQMDVSSMAVDEIADANKTLAKGGSIPGMEGSPAEKKQRVR